jgi:hypothetical protein
VQPGWSQIARIVRAGGGLRSAWRRPTRTPTTASISWHNHPHSNNLRRSLGMVSNCPIVLAGGGSRSAWRRPRRTPTTASTSRPPSTPPPSSSSGSPTDSSPTRPSRSVLIMRSDPTPTELDSPQPSDTYNREEWGHPGVSNGLPALGSQAPVAAKPPWPCLHIAAVDGSC